MLYGKMKPLQLSEIGETSFPIAESDATIVNRAPNWYRIVFYIVFQKSGKHTVQANHKMSLYK
jgi:hypothetical protein